MGDFFRYANDARFRETVNNVIESKEALQMAGNLLMSISQDERERAVFRSRRMYQSDLQSNLATAEDRGRKASKIEIARMMVAAGEPVEKIIRYTGLTQQEIASI